MHGAAPPAPLTTKPTLAQLAPAHAVGDNPGLASPDAEGSDSSQGSPSSLAYDQPGGGLYPVYSPDQSFMHGDGEGGIEMDEWVPKDDPFAGPLPHHTHADAELPQPPVGTWARKGSFGSRPSTPRMVSQQSHLKAGSWPEKQSHRRSVIVLERKDSLSSGQGHEFPLMVNKDGQGHELLPIGKSPPSTFARTWGDGHQQPHQQQERDMISF
ncbi:hypothetical protein C8R47DRAFT_1123914 [Mycena vitilis]|nr:hypothetical protein C8R47DRAFT_1123914 [Mycena vitilis]